MKRRDIQQCPVFKKGIVLILLLASAIQVTFSQTLATYPLRTGSGNPPAGTAQPAATSPNVNAGTMGYGINVQTGSGAHNSSGYRVKTQSVTWPTQPTDDYSFDIPLSPKNGFDLKLTKIQVDVNSLSYKDNSTIIYIAPYIQIDNNGQWIPLTPAQPVSSTTTTVQFNGIDESFFSGHTYIIRFYLYGSVNNDKNDNFRIINLVFSGTTSSPPTVAPGVKTLSATKSPMTPKYAGIVTGSYDFGSGYQQVKQSGVVWSKSPDPFIRSALYTTDGTNGTISSTLTGLTVNTTYYAKAYIITQLDTLYGAEMSFTTDPASLAEVTTNPVTNILSNKATGGGIVTDSGGVAITEKGLVWNTTGNPNTSSNTGKWVAGSGAQSFSDFIKGLTPNTKYYVKAYAINSLGTAYGDQVEFTTAAPAPVLVAVPGSIDFGENYYNTTPLTISYTLSGENLSPAAGTITVTAPAGFLVSLNGNNGFASSITVPYTGGAISGTPVYVQLPVTTYGSFSGNVIQSGGGVAAADADVVKVSGTIVSSPDEVTNRGTDFWLGFGYQEKMKTKAGDSGEAKLSVYISATDQPAQVIVDLPGIPGASGFPKTINVAANSVVEVTGFPTGDPNNSTNYNTAGYPDTRLYSTGISNKGIHVYSTNGTPIAVWMHTYADNNSAAGAMLFPTNTWSSQYVVQSYGGKTNTGIPNSFFFVIAGEDNTEVEFTPTNDIVNADQSSIFSDGHTAANVLYKKGVTYKITLNKGQVFNAMGFISGSGKNSANGLDLTGTVVKTTCDKKIAVFGGNGRVLVNTLSCSDTEGSDHLIQQMFPIVAWGTRYLTAPTKNMPNNLFRIVVEDPTTVVKKNGTVLNPSTLVNNLYYEVESNQPMVIESDKPINVIQFIVVGKCGGGGDGDPEMIILSPVQQAINKATVYSATIKKSGGGANGHYINVIIEKGAIDKQSFKLDNIDFNSTTKVDVGGTAAYSSSLVLMKDAFKVHPLDPNYYYAVFKVAPGMAHTISSDYAFNAIAYGMGDGESYGYNAGTAIKNLSSIKMTVNPAGSDTSSTSVKGGKNNPVTLKIALPYNPFQVDNIAWDPGTDTRVSPAGIKNGEIDTTTGKAKYDGTIEVEGRTFYIYTSPVQYTFSQDGIYRISAKATGTFSSECGGEDIEKILVLIGRDNVNFDFTTSCGNPTVSFDNHTTAMPGTTITKWAWDFGDGTSTEVQDPPPHTYDVSGGSVYMVKLTTTNSVGVITTDSVKVDFSGGIDARFSIAPKDTICAGETLSFDPSASSVTGTTSGTPAKWIWNFGEGDNVVIDGSTCPPQSHTYTKPGKYAVKLILETTSGCQNPYTDTVVVDAAPVSAIDAPARVCFDGDSITYKDASTISVGTISQWLWTFDDGTTSNLQNPKHKWLTPGKHTVTLLATSAGGCSATNTATHDIILDPLPTADFSLPATTCQNNSITFTDASAINAPDASLVEWNWDFGDGSAPLVQTTGDPVNHTYTSGGTYTIRLWVKSSTGCISNTASKDITINPLPKPGFTVPDVCIPDGKAQFTASSTAATVSQWLWDFGDGSQGTGQQPVHQYTTGGTYTVKLIAVTDKGCMDSVSKPVTIYNTPSASFSIANENKLCSSDPVSLTDQSVVNGFGSVKKVAVYWDYVNNPTEAETYDSPVPGGTYPHSYPAFESPATRTYTIMLRAYNENGCYTDFSKVITLNAMPVAHLAPLPAVCQEADPFNLTQGGIILSLPGNGVYSGTGITVSPQFSPQLAGPGTHRIRYTYTTASGCQSYEEQDIVVYPTPSVTFAQSTIYIAEGKSAQLKASAVTGDDLSYSWSPATYLDNPDSPNPVCRLGNDMTYTLTVKTKNGCNASSTLNVNILRELVVPNTFTPNGDGINDLWEIKYLDTYPGATVEIFNRYGKKVLSSSGVVKWDGKYNGEDLPAGTYYYMIDPKNGHAIISGSVTILR
ncbi:PKD domain-containing protein [Pedobacter sp. BS3]|uniref:PKD domain-containing protein n=1 Tax=Pedobacter sp. BS3 TaxID=2567937 RepID=UPI0011EE12D5|nr:PKD domain-containing protein [Pedobacter sp. BS3]TZF82060.1 PKD domain-containing protein [Pedobacter sp. BS3]